MAILVTGANGFVGRAIVEQLARNNRKVIALERKVSAWPQGVTSRISPDLEGMTAADWRPLLQGVDAIIHTAAMAHISSKVDPARYDAVNHRATATLAEAARDAGVRRLVFLSSIRAVAGRSWEGVVDEDTVPAPTDAYGVAKLAAEKAIAASGIKHVILRPVVIVGEGARGNVGLLRRMAQLPLPLPLRSLKSKRSLVDLREVVRMAIAAVDAPEMAGQTIILADPDPLALPEMVEHIRRGMGRSAGLFHAPPSLLRLAVATIGMANAWQSVAGGAIARSKWLPLNHYRTEYPVRDALQGKTSLS